MKLGITEWEGRISPVLDVSRRLRVIDYQPSGITEKIEVFSSEDDIYQRLQRIEALGLDLLICGAVSCALSNILEARGIKLVSFISGDIQDVLNAWEQGVLPRQELMMPGCGRSQGCKRRSRICPRGYGNRRRYHRSE